MKIGKKAALMTAAAGAMVIGTAGGASAYGLGGLTGGGNGVAQANSCDGATSAIITGAVAAPSGVLDVSSDCVNFTNASAGYQGNDCDTATGPVTTLPALAPTGDIDLGSNCTNIALADPPTIVVNKVEKKEKHNKSVKKEKKAKKKHAKKKAHGHH
ncbi:hypothetical protein ACFZCY_04580 [Streptomyces sp. NPDC007983]|uniref:hypothetical protein n=1 Tax=Streptomyces sp. NPDC007983 TaxID=3364800 RepID=UPI0036E95F86